METFTYEIDDGAGALATGSVAVTVTNTNDPPTATDDQFAVNPDSSNNPLDVLANDSADPDPGETITIVALTTPSHGTAENFGGTLIRYTPTAGYEGPDSFTYTIEDSNGWPSRKSANAPARSLPGMRGIRPLREPSNEIVPRWLDAPRVLNCSRVISPPNLKLCWPAR